MKEQWKEQLLDLKCINGAMYFGSVEDDTCDCKTSCINSQTFEHAVEELNNFTSSLLEEQKKELIEQILKDAPDNKNLLGEVSKDPLEYYCRVGFNASNSQWRGLINKLK